MKNSLRPLYQHSVTAVFLSLFSFFFFLNNTCLSQAGEWTWMKGSNFAGSMGSYGTQGVPDATNTPPGSYEGFTWRDKENNLWYFGGLLIANVHSALWKYDIATNTWTWMKGPSTDNSPGVYGTQGIPSPNNYPGGRAYGGFNWVDSAGNFWLFGAWGYTSSGFGLLSDLWKFDPTTNEWTWMSGTEDLMLPPVFSTFQVPSVNANPGGRGEVGAGWVDNNNHLWLYGGQGISGSYGDVWNYNVSTNEWAWMNGINAFDPPAVYGTQGIFDPTNTPGGRWVYPVWSDDVGNGWIFGGIAPTDLLADLWQYDVVTNEWAWISGSSTGGDLGVHGAACESSASFYPSSRGENRACWTDKCKNFWMFGGSSSDQANDLWLYDRINNEWTFVKGSFNAAVSPTFGTQGLSSATNDPGFRTGSSSWADTSGNLWLFGGIVTPFGEINDLWRFVPDPSCPAAVSCYASSIQFIASNSDICEKFCTDFFDQSTNNPTSWDWQFPGGIPSSSTDQNPTNICYSTPGIYDVILTTNSSSGTNTLTLPGYIHVNPTPPLPVITQSGYTLTSSAAVTYQWQFNNVDIPGATNQSYDVQQSGYYTVIIADSNSCSSSATVYILIEGINDLQSNDAFFIYPNPSPGSFNIELWSNDIKNFFDLKIYNTLGQEVFYTVESGFPGNAINSGSPSTLKKEISLDQPAPGIYFIEVKWENGFARKKIIVRD